MTTEAAAEDFEEQFQVVGIAGAVDDGEGASAEGGVHFAAVIAVCAGAFDDDGGWGLVEAREEVQEAGACFLGVGVLRVVQREAQVDDRDVDSADLDDFGGFAAGGGPEGADAHGFKEAGKAVGPGVGLPAGVGEEEVQPAARRGGLARDAAIRLCGRLGG